MITDSNVVSAVEHADLEACETPAKAGIAVDGLDEATGDDMDCDVVPVSQVSVVYDDDIIEVLETGFSGDRLMDTDAGTGQATLSLLLMWLIVFVVLMMLKYCPSSEFL